MFSAPGKLFLFGEYAVLRGAPAIVTAVDRRVRITPTEDGSYEVLGTSQPDNALPRAIEAVTGRSLGGWRVDLTQMYDGEDKLGLGSSAASCVALTAAVLPNVDPSEIFDAAFRAHRKFQNGAGSGADVAVSTYGGTLAVRASDTTPAVERIELPEGLRAHAVWTGQSANTRDFVAAVDREGTSSQLDDLYELAVAGRAAFLAKDVRQIVKLVGLYDAAMGRLGVAAGVPIRTPVHESLCELAARLGAVAKPSGAGGGDISLVFSDEDLDVKRFEDGLPAGARLLELRLDAPGVVSFHEQ